MDPDKLKIRIEKVAEVDTKYFKVIGLWQFVVDREVSWWVLLNFAIGCVFLLNISLQVVVTLTGSYDFNVFTEKLAVNLTVMESCIKIIYYCSKRSQLSDLTSAFRWDLLKCTHHDPPSSRGVMTKGLSLVNRVTKSFVIMIFSTVGVWNALPILKCILSDDCSKWTIMPSWYPNNWEFSGFVYVFEFFIMVYCAGLLYNVNCFFSALALSLSSQFELLSSSLSSIEGKAAEEEGLTDQRLTDQRLTDQRLTDQRLADQRLADQRLTDQRLMDRLLRDCLADHQTVLKLSKNMENLYNPLFLCQMLASTFTICLVLIQINVALSSNELPLVTTCKFLMYLVFGLMELLLYSLGGQILSDQSEKLHGSLYESGWTEGSRSFKTNILIAMTRTVRPVSLTAGKFYSVNLQSFTQILKASYSYFAFLVFLQGSDSSGR